MLQASEYRLSDYFAWLHRVRDFSAVEKRKRLDMTAKARMLLASLWLMVVLGIITAIWLTAFGFAWGLLILPALPYIIAYAIVMPLRLLLLIQLPIERRRIARAQATLRKHKAVKIGIAGSFGKTTMREILKAVLSSGKKVAAPPGSYNTPLGVASFVETLQGDEDVLIFELGEYYPGDVRVLCELVSPTLGVITGVNEAHLEKFKSLDATAATVFELADYLGDKPVYVNGENALARSHAWQGTLIYGSDGVGDIRVLSSKTDLTGTEFVALVDGVETAFTSSLLGLHHIGSLAAAIHIARKLGLASEEVRRGVAATKPFEHRLDPRESGGVVTLDDSYNGNPDGARAVIAFLGSLAGRRRFYVTPGLVEMGSRTREVHLEIGRQLAGAGVEKVVLIRNSVTPFIEEGLKDANYSGEVLWFDDGPTAFSALPHLTVPGDVVLLQNDWPDQYA